MMSRSIFFTFIFFIAGLFMLSSCKKETPEPEPAAPALQSSSFSYNFNNGELFTSLPYTGNHLDNLSAAVSIQELASGKAIVEVKLFNSIQGEIYHVHAHDQADPNQTPNGTPYLETPNVEILTKAITGNGGTVTIAQTTNKTYAELSNYTGYFIVHDPMQAISTSNITTYLVIGKFNQSQVPTTLKKASFNYAFNTGQIDTAYAYLGTHPITMTAELRFQELANSNTRLMVRLNNTLTSKEYHIHAHDLADTASTPNNTPYLEAPNVNVLISMITGNGKSKYINTYSNVNFVGLTQSYEGYLVVHDPLVPLTTANPKSYIIFDRFAR